MLFDGTNGIAGTCRGESARWGEQRRDAGTIEIDGEKEEKREKGRDARTDGGEKRGWFHGIRDSFAPYPEQRD